MKSMLPQSWQQGQYRVLGMPQGASRSSAAHGRIWKWGGLAAVILFMLWMLCSPKTTFFELNEHGLCEHPVARLVRDAEQSFNTTLERQSKSLEEAVAEYRRRYRMPPPPHFDKWYEFARERGTVLIDEFDTIYHAILPFWGVTPSVIRSRVREDLGYENRLMGVSIRKGVVVPLAKGQGDFQDVATQEILSLFGKWLPDMDLAFNIHDEPRVVVAHEDLHRMAMKGRSAQSRLNLDTENLNNTFSNTPVHPISTVTTTRFNDIERQETWLYSRLSCPPDTPARDLDGGAPDNSSAYAVEPLGFVFNQTAASDICLSPSLRRRLGLFDHPNAFKLTNELTPVFSTSRPSSFQDIVVPSPWYYKDLMSFNSSAAVPWDDKTPDLYWRGGSTGGVSVGGSWRNLQRQYVLDKLTNPESVYHTLRKKEDVKCKAEGGHTWEIQEADQAEMQSKFNTYFIGISHCEEDCWEENSHFFVAPFDDQREAWKHRYLLDLDGFAYSGRFYAFMRSASVPFKLTLFREWHENVLIPWLHYVPINKDVEEVPELIRFFEHDRAGQVIARRIGEEGQKWALRTLRNEDIEVYMFRLFLEYVLDLLIDDWH
ncbi:Lipopolysaccharide-modifying protein [Penicillium capsulatum]|uniref:Lipopolysaccharide-modifying protein n=1 Tax=Penicillium capsulatum TaxID=69766 RepID=A0A9W9M0W2_9EURO|nr:Lipopolysaccharide-modifying protein [Penicillium capsulatum]KAJ6129811.1 Lipopolysaccharide-modifying protein [Penicillium capsulatum]